MVVIGLVLTSFEGIIVLNTINYVESCDTIIVRTQAQITNHDHRAALGSSAEVDVMMQKRNKSGVPFGQLVGQIPKDDRWKFDANLDVDPYAWKSSCLLYKSGMTQVNMNTSVLYSTLGLREALPEVHAEFIFRNSPDGYNYTRGQYETYVYYNRTDSTDTFRANGALILLVEEFRRGDYYTIGKNYINRMWTIRVPETVRIPYDPDNLERSEMVSVPITVKAYTCEMERIKEDSHGSYNVLNHDLFALVSTTGILVGRKWNLAVISGKDTSIYELTPEHWASYLAVKDTQTAEVEDVLARINMPSITVHPAYISLVCLYILMFIIGTYLVIIRWKKCRIPSGVIDWARFACKESRTSYNIEHGLFDYNLVPSDNDLKIKI